MSQPPTPARWFDAHLDLAYLGVLGRDMGARTAQEAGGPHPPGAITFPALAEGGVRAALGTIFTEADGADEPVSYASGDAEAALAAGLRQLAQYHTWRDAGLIELMGSNRAARPTADPGKPLPSGTPGMRPARRPNPRISAAPGAETENGGINPDPEILPARNMETADTPRTPPLRIGILIEGADPITRPDDLAWWAEWGVVAVGMAWWKPSRYAGGNGTDLGLTDLGRELIRVADGRGIVHDASHLSDRALDELFTLTDRPVIASHSNCRALMDGVNQRHLTDAAIREIARRGGVIGLNLYSKFLKESIAENAQAALDDCARHLDHIRAVTGYAAAIGLGSDMDGGFSALRLPDGIRAPRDLSHLARALAGRGWTPAEIEGFAWGNWARFWNLTD